MKKYKVVNVKDQLVFSENKGLEELEKEVNDLLSNGWELVGGISIAFDSIFKVYCFSQALVKEVEE